MDTIIDFLFFHCYNLARANDESAKAGMACHIMSFVLILVGCSLISVASLVMPKKFVYVVGIITGIVIVVMYSGLISYYENDKIRTIIVEKYGNTTMLKSVMVVVLYVVIATSPVLLINLISSYLQIL